MPAYIHRIHNCKIHDELSRKSFTPCSTAYANPGPSAARISSDHLSSRSKAKLSKVPAHFIRESVVRHKIKPACYIQSIGNLGRSSHNVYNDHVSSRIMYGALAVTSLNGCMVGD